LSEGVDVSDAESRSVFDTISCNWPQAAVARPRTSKTEVKRAAAKDIFIGHLLKSVSFRPLSALIFLLSANYSVSQVFFLINVIIGFF
jgi:hypothetical protein